MAHVTQKTYIIETEKGRIKSEFPFISCEIASRLTPFQKQIMVESIIERYLLIMETAIDDEQMNDRRQDELFPIRAILNAAGISIQLIEKI